MNNKVKKIILSVLATSALTATSAMATELSGWAVNYIRVAKANNLILERADGLFSGRTEVTRGDAAIMIKRLYDCLR